MAFSINMGVWGNVFAVPKIFTEKYLKMCGENELKFILCLFSNPTENFDKESIADLTGIPLKYIDDCFDYWLSEGLISINDTNINVNFGEYKKEVQNKIKIEDEIKIEDKKEEITPIKEIKRELKMLRPDSLQIAKRINENPEIAYIFSHSEQALGKTMSPSLSAALLIAYDDYNLPADVLCMLITHCVKIKRTSTPYIESMTKKWHKEQIVTMSLADNKINEMNLQNESWKRFSALVGLNFRSPSEAESVFCYETIMVMGFSDEMIKLCYDICVDRTGKYQHKYMAKIFKNWHDKNIKKPEDVKSFDNEKKEEKRETSFDIDDFDKSDIFYNGN